MSFLCDFLLFVFSFSFIFLVNSLSSIFFSLYFVFEAFIKIYNLNIYNLLFYYFSKKIIFYIKKIYIYILIILILGKNKNFKKQKI